MTILLDGTYHAGNLRSPGNVSRTTGRCERGISISIYLMLQPNGPRKGTGG